MGDSEIFVSYTHHSMIRTSAFNCTLQNEFKVHSKGKHIASFTDGGEIWMQIFASLDFKSALVGGILYDLAKHGTKSIFATLYTAINDLVKENIDHAEIDFQRITFEFNDITICGIKKHYTSTIFLSLVNCFGKIEERKLGRISEIIIPMIKDSKDKLGYRILNSSDDPTLDDFLKYWRININDGVDWYIYDLENDNIVNSIYSKYEDKKPNRS